MAYTLAWLTRWAFASISASLALQIFGDADLSFVANPEGLIRRSVRIFLGGLEVAIVWILLDSTRHWVVEHLKRLPEGESMSARTLRQVLAVLVRQLLIAAVMLLTFGPLTRWISDTVLWVLRDLDAATPQSTLLGWWGPLAAVAIAGFGLSIAVLGGLSRIRASIRAYGWWFPGAMLRMAHMRFLGPPRDFFEFAPVIRSLPTLALSAFVWVDAPHAATGWFALAALLAMTTLTTVLAVLPPVWVFFSSSKYFQFEVFRILRV